MGAFYGSTQVRREERDAVVSAVEKVARARGVKCLISPILDGWIGIYPENQGQDEQFGAAIAQRLDGVVLHMLVHDSDVMAYWLWRDHQLVDSYWSRPGYFGEENRAKQERMAGRPEAFGSLIGEKAEQVAEILRRDQPVFALEDERLERFAKLLGISNALNAYEYMKEGDAVGRKGWRKFTEVPADAAMARAKEQQDERNQVKEKRWLAVQERKALEKDGLLLFRDERKERMSAGYAAGGGYLVAWRDFRAGSASLDSYLDPWDGSTLPGLEFPPEINAMASEASGRWLAIVAGHRIRVWDMGGEEGMVVADVPDADGAMGLAISSDGTTLAKRLRDEIVVTQIANQETLLRVAAPPTNNMAFHPSGEWIVASGKTLGLICVPQEPRWRDLLIGGQFVSPFRLGGMMRSHVRKIDVDSLKRQHRAGIDAAMAKMQQALKQAKKGRRSARQLEVVRRLEERMEEMRPQLEKDEEEWLSRIEAIKEGREPSAPLQAKGAGGIRRLQS